MIGLQGLLLRQDDNKGPAGGLLHGWGAQGVLGVLLLLLQMLLRWSSGRCRPRGSGRRLMLLKRVLLLHVLHLLVQLLMLLLLKQLMLLLGHLLLMLIRMLLLHMLHLLVLLQQLLLLLGHMLLLGHQLLLLQRLRCCGSTLREASAIPQRDELII